jgi:hypothetical protein
MRRPQGELIEALEELRLIIRHLIDEVQLEGQGLTVVHLDSLERREREGPDQADASQRHSLSGQKRRGREGDVYFLGHMGRANPLRPEGLLGTNTDGLPRMRYPVLR